MLPTLELSMSFGMHIKDRQYKLHANCFQTRISFIYRFLHILPNANLINHSANYSYNLKCKIYIFLKDISKLTHTVSFTIFGIYQVVLNYKNWRGDRSKFKSINLYFFLIVIEIFVSWDRPACFICRWLMFCKLNYRFINHINRLWI